jgi:hypothetical protein
MTMLDQVRALKANLTDTMIGLLDLDVDTLEPDLTVVRMPYHPEITSGFHGPAIHHGALLGLASTTAFLHALRLTHPGATTVTEWFHGPQPFVLESVAEFFDRALGDVTAFATLLQWPEGFLNSLQIRTSLRVPDGVEVAGVTTRHRVPAGRPIPVDVPLGLL